ncbi:MAG: outer membrane beta-barrel protein [Bacteroidales bacterium]
MKRISVLTVLIFTFLNTLLASGQDTMNIRMRNNEIINISEDGNRTRISIAGDRLELEAAGENVKIRLGKRGIEISDGNNIDWKKYEDVYYYDDTDDPADKRRRDRRRFTPHWSAIEIGINNYLTSDYSMSLPPELSYMDLHTGKSFNININFAQLGIGLTRHFGIVTGLGLEFNDYKFEGNNNISKDEEGVIGPMYPADGIEYEKTKLTTTYLTMPLMLEAQIPVRYSRTLNIAAGAIGGVKLGSHNKLVYYDGGKQKVKEKDDFSLSVLRYGPTVRLGYDSFQVYATYYMNGLFLENKGPELYPFQLGIAIAFND